MNEFWQRESVRHIDHKFLSLRTEVCLYVLQLHHADRGPPPAHAQLPRLVPAVPGGVISPDLVIVMADIHLPRQVSP